MASGLLPYHETVYYVEMNVWIASSVNGGPLQGITTSKSTVQCPLSTGEERSMKDMLNFRS